MRLDCVNKYSQTDSAELKIICDSNRKEKRTKSKASWNKENKKAKIGRPQQEIDTIIKTMHDTGKSMNTIYKETSLGGLAVNVVEC